VLNPFLSNGSLHSLLWRALIDQKPFFGIDECIFGSSTALERSFDAAGGGFLRPGSDEETARRRSFGPSCACSPGGGKALSVGAATGRVTIPGRNQVCQQRFPDHRRLNRTTAPVCAPFCQAFVAISVWERFLGLR